MSRWYLDAEAARARLGAREPWQIDVDEEPPRRKAQRPIGVFCYAPPPWWPDEPEENEE